MATKLIDPDAILDFWFDDCAHQPESISTAKQRWYRGGVAVDRFIEVQFQTMHASAADSPYPEGLTERGIPARIILLDQFARHLYRGQPKAFAFDPLALNLSHRLNPLDAVLNLQPIEKVSALHPYHHAENRTAQQLGIDALKGLISQVVPVWRGIILRFLKSFEEHALIIERFGRFPHRNQTLKRRNTVEETRHLAQQHKQYG